MEIHFSKLQENGNDFIVIDEHEKPVIPEDMKAQFAAIYCDRRFGIGADGVIYLMKSETCDLKMRLFRADVGEDGTAGNGIRCLAKYACDAGYVKDSCSVETPSGKIDIGMGYKDEDFFATIMVATPLFDRKDIPAIGSGEYKEEIDGFEIHGVNTGAPHAVIIVDSVDAVDLAEAGPKISHHKTFQKGASVNVVERTGSDSIRIRTYEQGTEDEVLSCGTGATAAAAVIHKLGLAGDVVEVETRGGSFTIYLKDAVRIEGKATTVFFGIIGC